MWVRYTGVLVLGVVLGIGGAKLGKTALALVSREEKAPTKLPEMKAATNARRCQHLRDAQGKQGELYLKQLRDIYGEGYHPCLDKELLGMLDTMVLAPVQPSRTEEEERAR